MHLTVARVYLEMGGFSRALEGLQGSYKIATSIGDPALELQVYVALSELFGRLQDTDKSAKYASKAYDLSRSLQVIDFLMNSCRNCKIENENKTKKIFPAGRFKFISS